MAPLPVLRLRGPRVGRVPVSAQCAVNEHHAALGWELCMDALQTSTNSCFPRATPGAPGDAAHVEPPAAVLSAASWHLPGLSVCICGGRLSPCWQVTRSDTCFSWQSFLSPSPALQHLCQLSPRCPWLGASWEEKTQSRSPKIDLKGHRLVMPSSNNYRRITLEQVLSWALGYIPVVNGTDR